MHFVIWGSKGHVGELFDLLVSFGYQIFVGYIHVCAYFFFPVVGFPLSVSVV